MNASVSWSMLIAWGHHAERAAGCSKASPSRPQSGCRKVGDFDGAPAEVSLSQSLSTPVVTESARLRPPMSVWQHECHKPGTVACISLEADSGRVATCRTTLTCPAPNACNGSLAAATAEHSAILALLLSLQVSFLTSPVTRQGVMRGRIRHPESISPRRAAE